ncbi:MAG TPA: PhzF family phenazine biosynthesis protein [Actinomycetota bacterium]|nr:PhzF family phenazine biosynthesis protein [Actinomycetota bacterium]
MDVGFRLADAFTETPFQGNRLCVVPEVPDGFTTEQMAMLALETNFSETTFVTESRPDGYRMRIFTPDAELPFAGHPTIGTAFILASEGRTGTTTVQTTTVGDVPVEVDLEYGFAWMTQPPPEIGPEFSDRSLVAAASGLQPDDLDPNLPMQLISTGLAPLLVPVRDEAALRRAERHEPTVRRATEASGGECLYLFAIRGDGDVMARMFDASFGVGEDPATGSAAGPLGVYLAARGLAGMPGDAVVAQGELVGRPSFLHLSVRPDRDSWSVRVGGGVRIVGEGVFRVPD